MQRGGAEGRRKPESGIPVDRDSLHMVIRQAIPSQEFVAIASCDSGQRSIFELRFFSGRGTKMDKNQIKPFAWGAVAGAIALSIIMFSTGWAVTSSTSNSNARKMSEAAVVDNLAGICVAQFERAEDRDVKLNALVETDSWRRSTYVTDQGWATMPGSESPTRNVANVCAERLAKLHG